MRHFLIDSLDVTNYQQETLLYAHVEFIYMNPISYSCILTRYGHNKHRGSTTCCFALHPWTLRHDEVV